MGRPPERRVARRRLDRDEADLWDRAMRDVRRLEGGDTPPPLTVDAPPVTPRAPAAAETPPPPLDREKAPPATLPDLVTGITAGLDRRSADRLKRGKMAVEASIDLHGMTQEKAAPALTAFLAGAQEAGRRCVLVITGKGHRNQDDGGSGTGVLRGAVPHWLNRPPNRARIVSVVQATPRDGGAGALYVLLRRRR